MKKCEMSVATRMRRMGVEGWDIEWGGEGTTIGESVLSLPAEQLM